MQFAGVLTAAVDLLLLPWLLLLCACDMLVLLPIRYYIVSLAVHRVDMSAQPAPATAARMSSELEMLQHTAEDLLREKLAEIPATAAHWSDPVFEARETSLCAPGDMVEEIDVMDWELFGRLGDSKLCTAKFPQGRNAVEQFPVGKVWDSQEDLRKHGVRMVQNIRQAALFLRINLPPPPLSMAPHAV